MRRSSLFHWAMGFRLLLIPAVSFAAAQAEETPTVYVSFWFDTEDYILPESDDAAKRIADMFTQRNVKATFKMVGEKARVLEERGRNDVILALSQHDIGYHTTYHSIHPTPAEYCRHLGWREGIDEFLRREGVGVEIVRRVFGVAPSCYGQPGGSWTPQSYAALRELGILLYLDESRHVGLNDRPYWYAGALNVSNLGDFVVRQRDWSDENLEQTIERFDRAYRTLLEEGGGMISIYYHPCEFIHEDFWDAVNFDKGATPPRSEWKRPPMKSPDEQERAFRTFEALLDHVVAQPNVRLVTSREIPALYPDHAYTRPLDRFDVMAIAKAMQEQISYIALGDRVLSAAEGLFALAYVVAEADGDYIPETVELAFAYGPAGTPEEYATEGNLRWEAVQEAARGLVERIYETEQLPSVVWISGKALRPEDFAATIAKPVEALLRRQPLPEAVPMVQRELEAGQYVADHSRRLWGWRIFPEGFEAPRMMALAKLQAWTIKPAVLRTASAGR